MTSTPDTTARVGALDWQGPAIGLLDLDAFFASVEQLDHPEWRGHPVIVGGSAERRGVVSTASYEARTYGVHSAMPSAQAKRLCPEAIWTHGHFTRYREMSAAVMEILERETPLVEQVSIDEAFFDVSPGRFSRENPVEICRRVQARVADLGVTCSIGIGVNKTVAKIASEREKPRGLTVVWPGSEQTFLAPLPVRALSGVGASTAATLSELGIRTLGELARADEATLERELGVMGPRMKLRAAGLERSRVAAYSDPVETKSVSNERTFDRDLTDEDEIHAAILHVAEVTARRLRKKGLRGRTVTLKLKYDATHGRTAQGPLYAASDEGRQIGKAAADLLPRIWTLGMPVRLVGVGVSGFNDEGDQLDLFADASSDASRAALSRATDAVRDKFGPGAVAFGRDLRFQNHVSDTSPEDKSDD